MFWRLPCSPLLWCRYNQASYFGPPEGIDLDLQIIARAKMRSGARFSSWTITTSTPCLARMFPNMWCCWFLSSPSWSFSFFVGGGLFPSFIWCFELLPSASLSLVDVGSVLMPTYCYIDNSPRFFPSSYLFLLSFLFFLKTPIVFMSFIKRNPGAVSYHCATSWQWQWNEM